MALFANNRRTPSYCGSMPYKLGEMLGSVGDATNLAGLGASLMGGPEFLPLAALGGGASTVGDLASAYAGDARARRRLLITAGMGGVGGLFVPRSVKNTVAERIINFAATKGAAAAVDGAAPDACR